MAFNLFLKPALANLFIGHKQSGGTKMCSILLCAYRKIHSSSLSLFSLPACLLAAPQQSEPSEFPPHATGQRSSHYSSGQARTVQASRGLGECHARNATVTIIGNNSPEQKETRVCSRQPANKGTLAAHTHTHAHTTLKHTSNWLQNCNNNNNNSICPQQMLVLPNAANPSSADKKKRE